MHYVKQVVAKVWSLSPEPATADPQPEDAAPVRAPVRHASADASVIASVAALDKQLASNAQREDALARQISDLDERAIAMAKRGNKPQALRLLQRRKQHEASLAQLGATSTRLETLKFQLQSAAANRDVLEAQRLAAGNLEEMNAAVGGSVDDTLDMVKAAMDSANYVSEQLGTPVNSSEDAALLAELDTIVTADALSECPVPAGGLPSAKPVVAAASVAQPTAATPVPVAAAVSTSAAPGDARQRLSSVSVNAQVGSKRSRDEEELAELNAMLMRELE